MDNSQISDVSFWSLQYNSLLKCHRKAICRAWEDSVVFDTFLSFCLLSQSELILIHVLTVEF